jgi:peptidoglycan/LPS O-acetylase OafA/YrhL
MPAIVLSTPAPVVGRIPLLDELKGLAILLIVLYHAGGVLIWSNYLHGDVGVDIFLLLSGAGLAFSAKPETFGGFMRRRLLRLMPVYWVVLTVYLVCNVHFLQLRYSALNVVTHYLGIHGFFGDAIGLAINDSFWFITTILGLYVAFWCLRPLLERPDRFLLAAGSISAAVALILFFTGQAGLMGHVGFRVPAFFLGMLAGHLFKTGRIQIPATAAAGLGLLLVAYVPYTRGITFYSAVVAVALICLYAWALRPRLSDHSVPARTLAFVGRHSLEIFLIHQPLMREYNYYLHGRWLNVPSASPLSLVVGMALALVVTVMVSIELNRLQRLLLRS